MINLVFLIYINILWVTFANGVSASLLVPLYISADPFCVYYVELGAGCGAFLG